MVEEETKMKPDETNPNLPSVDFTGKFNLVKLKEGREKDLWKIVCDLSAKNYNKKKPAGLLLVFGEFDKRDDGRVYGMLQVKSQNPVDTAIFVSDKKFTDRLYEMMQPPHDGAIIINHTGQMIGGDIMLSIEDYEVSVSDECGTRHVAAASFSKRKDVYATFTISEETYKARKFKDGNEDDIFDPVLLEEKKKEKEENGGDEDE